LNRCSQWETYNNYRNHNYFNLFHIRIRKNINRSQSFFFLCLMV
jgi:hypothetical protein